MIARTITVSGRVQGVGFRRHTLIAAEKYSITGWVMNLNNGSVLISAMGKEEDMNTFLSSCKRGPRHAVVNEISVSATEPTSVSNFKIIR